MKERGDPTVLPEDRDIALAVDRAPGNLNFLIRAALLTGCRQEELVTLERRHVDLAREAISVLGKGNTWRVISLSPEAVAQFRKNPVSMVTRRVFGTSDGRPVRNIATRLSLYAGLSGFSDRRGSPGRKGRRCTKGGTSISVYIGRENITL